MEMVIDPVVTNLGAVPLTHPVVSEASLGWTRTPKGKEHAVPGVATRGIG